MSGPGSVNPKRREIEIIRVLFDRQLADRAVALAESRWPGSGDVVRLAYEWGQLGPSERRDRISSIGPAEIARLRELTTLNPELQATIDELGRRGVLPNLEQAALAGAASVAGSEPGETTQLDAMLAERDSDAAQTPDASPPPDQIDAQAAPDPPEISEPESPPPPPPPVELPEEMQVDMPALDLGLPDAETFLETETRRRAETVQKTEAAMERVHERLERAAGKTWSRTFPTATLPSIAPMPQLSDLTALTTTQVRPPEALPQRGDSNLIEAPQRIIDAFTESRVLSLASQEEAPSDDELVAIANELGLGLKEFSLEPGRMREVYGGLGRVGSQIKVTAGLLPSALAAKNLVVVRGRMFPTLIDRLNAGFADIPGTRATVKVHPDARVLVIPT